MITKYIIIKLLFIQQKILSAFDVPDTVFDHGTREKQMPPPLLTTLALKYLMFKSISKKITIFINFIVT